MSAEQLITEHLDLWTSTVKTKNTQGRGSNSKRELYGIKKLRELILELAVRGKLVPQYPKDEPAGILLRRIAQKKSLQKSKGKTTKQKGLLETAEQETPFELPSGWAKAYIPEVVADNKYAIKRGPFGSALKKAFFVEAGYKVYEQQHAINDDFYRGDYYIDESKFSELAAFAVHPNDLIISCSGTVGRVAVAPFDMEPGIINQALLKITLNESALTNQYFKILFPAFYMQTETLSDLQGTAQKNMVPVDTLKNEPFPLPPLLEQHRIVAKVDELMALCDQLEQQTESSLDAHNLLVDTLLTTLTDAQDANELSANWARLADHFDTLITTDYAVEQLKQTILQLAVQGKLVPQDPNDEPASELLKRIAAEKEQLVRDKKIKRQKPLAAISERETPFDLPENWEWVRLGNLGFSSTGKTPSTKDASNFTGDVPFIGPGQITPTGKLLDADKHLSEKGALSSTVAMPGDLLMVCIGGSIGKSALCDKRVAFNQQINTISPIYILPSYLHAAVSTDRFYRSVLDESTGSATPIINRSKWEELLVALCPEQEQHRIVTRLGELMTICDHLKDKLKDKEGNLLNLTNAIVEAAR